MTPAQSPPPLWLIGAFPIFLPLIWLFVSSMLGWMSGWFQLQRQFPRDDDMPLLKIGGQSDKLGWVDFNGILSLAACHSGLRVGMWRIFGPVCRPFQVPWNQIEAERVTRFLMPMVRLHLGRPVIRKLTIRARTWDRLKAASQGIAPPDTTDMTRRLAHAFLAQWAGITLLAGSFFYLGPRLLGPATDPPPQIPLIVCFGFPAVFFGVVSLVRFLAAAR